MDEERAATVVHKPTAGQGAGAGAGPGASDSSDNTDPGIVRFTQKPPAPEEARAHACEGHLPSMPFLDMPLPSFPYTIFHLI